MRQFIIYMILSLLLCSCTNPLKEVFDNYKINHNRIDSICNYFHKIKPDSIDLYIRINKENTLDIVLWDKHIIRANKSIFDKYGDYSKYDISLNDSTLTTVLESISIKSTQIDSIKGLLKSINCNSIGYKYQFWDISNAGGFVEIGYPTNDFYGLDYIIMDSVKNADFLKNVETMCNYKVINNKTLLNYGGPAWGSDCFPDKK